ncbi:hypothetical protein FA13DRAFT_1709596 [Coprinellus micaceus]|uniref:Uncharacterized protein n=1 Tax=Coprinellus micaceus TaxID=71717 RepID=A0A4Y7TDP4_COPMI|nr:hypothetical protein FA13DRAFT_1709596 [Coprinellus micaceus]
MMGKGKRSKDQVVRAEVESEDEAVEGILHVGLHKGYKDMTNSKFIAVDKILQKQLEEVVGEPEAFDNDSCANFRGNPEATLKKALSKHMTWEAIEREFMQSRFWKRDCDPKTKHSDFEAHDANPTILRITNFWRSRQDILDKQLEESVKFVPKAKSWFDSFVDDPDISDYLELDMEKVWSEIADVNGVVEGPNGQPIGQERDRFGMIEKSFLDIGIVRLPDIEKPHVKVFRVKLTVWSQVSKKLILRSGVRGELRSCKYGPRDEHMEAIKEAVNRVKTGGSWRFQAKGNTMAVRIRKV